MKKELAIVIPCYNEENRIKTETFISFYTKTNYTFCFVNDGSSDNTISILTRIQKNRNDRIIIISRNENKGKAESVREGITFLQNQNKFEWIGFLDADLATPLDEITAMLASANKNSLLKIIVGTRFRRLGSTIERSFNRFFIGRVFATLVSSLLGIPIYDTQCGAKLFKYDIIEDVFNEKFTSPWLFDVEIFFRIINKYGKANALKIILEYPLSKWFEIKGSKLKLQNFVMMPFELLKITIKYKKTY